MLEPRSWGSVCPTDLPIADQRGLKMTNLPSPEYSRHRTQAGSANTLGGAGYSLSGWLPQFSICLASQLHCPRFCDVSSPGRAKSWARVRPEIISRSRALWQAISLGATQGRRTMELMVEQSALSQQVLLEHQTLGHIVNAIRATIGWNYQGPNLARKIVSLRFVGQSLQRHLKHLMGLEEEDGYMVDVLETRPELKDEVESLRQEHVHFRTGLNRILNRLKKVSTTDQATVSAISDTLLALLEKLDAHSHKETGLIQDALLTDEGGEG